MLNASVGVQRVLGRLRPGLRARSDLATRTHRRSLRLAGRLAALGRPHLGHERALPVAAAAILLAASVLSVLPDVVDGGAVGGPSGDGPGPRLAIGGQGQVLDATAGNPDGRSFTPVGGYDPLALGLLEEPSPPPSADGIDGPFLADGTLIKPVAVDTSVADGSGRLRQYTVRSGDTLVGIAKQMGVSMMTLWWANSLKSKTDFRVGEVLTIPPVDGLVVRVVEGDTLESLAARYKVDADLIFRTNELDDRTLVIGQTLILPGAKGAPIPTPTPRPTRKPSSTGGGTVRPPSTYRGGSFVWPVVGGGNYISQPFHYGHYGLDIAADYGSRVRAAAAGTVTFAGWKNNGGGYQVWIAHGSGLYTTYNHMSSVSVGRGQAVGRGQQVGRVGQSGNATGPHLHFEVWRGPIWDGGTRVNPLIYL